MTQQLIGVLRRTVKLITPCVLAVFVATACACSSNTPKPQGVVDVYTLKDLELAGEPTKVSIHTEDSAVWERLSRVSDLTLLEVHASDLTNVQLRPFAKHKIHKVIFVSCSGLTAELGSSLAEMTSLSDLDIEGCEADDGFYEAISTSRSVVRLGISKSAALPKSTPLIARMPNLEVLSIRHVLLSSEWGIALSEADSLYRLTIQDTKLDPQFTFSFVSSMNAMKYLHINRCTGGSSDAFVSLKDATQLATLNLVDQEGISAELLDSFRVQLPSTTIER
jgi:hypothetical protein